MSRASVKAFPGPPCDYVKKFNAGNPWRSRGDEVEWQEFLERQSSQEES